MNAVFEDSETNDVDDRNFDDLIARRDEVAAEERGLPQELKEVRSAPQASPWNCLCANCTEHLMDGRSRMIKIYDCPRSGAGGQPLFAKGQRRWLVGGQNKARGRER